MLSSLILGRVKKSCRCAQHVGVWERRGMSPLILNLGTKWKSIVSFTSLPLFSPKKCPPHSGSTEMRLREIHSSCGRFGERETSCLWRELKHDSSDALPVTWYYTDWVTPVVTMYNIILFYSLIVFFFLLS
jgi:hypothetical protein